MSAFESIFKTTSMATLGAGIGYATSLFLPVINPIAGAINGFSFGLIISKTGKNLLDVKKEELSAKDMMVRLATITISLIASAGLSFLICFSLNNPVSFSACLFFPFIMGCTSSLVMVPAHFSAKLVHNLYLRLT